MSRELKTIHVSKETWRKLVELKHYFEFRSMDEVIRWLLERADLRDSTNERRGG
jgi:predicted CopG family antitoxin